MRNWPRAALLSLSDKGGAEEFARRLARGGTRLLASGGTARHLEQAGLKVTPVEQWPGMGELLGGRVKTLHPHIHAPILARRDVPADLTALEELSLEPIDLVAVTLYPFEQRAATLDEAAALEEIDIGGVALLRAAAKNHRDVVVIHDPSQYAEVLEALESDRVTAERRREWAARAFARTARYDAAIASELERRGSGGEPPALHLIGLERVRTLRYGENPHQGAALYGRSGARATLAARREGKELSYNNWLDLMAAGSLAWRFDAPSCVIVKHGEPCGAASARSLAEACRLALESDALSAFGGIAAINRPLDPESAALLARPFLECVAAPEFPPEALRHFESKKNLRVLSLGRDDVTSSDHWSVRILGQWALLQSEPAGETAPWRAVTHITPNESQVVALRFAWEIAAAARSNAAALASGTALIGLGSGQTSRVDAVDVAVMKARRSGHPLEGTVLASDGFFPFPDGVEHAARAGVAALVQPGGSVRDPEVIAACDRLGVSMMFTDRRMFRH